MMVKAWIRYVRNFKTKKTIYFNNHAFQKYNSDYANYIDIVKMVMNTGFLVYEEGE